MDGAGLTGRDVGRRAPSGVWGGTLVALLAWVAWAGGPPPASGAGARGTRVLAVRHFATAGYARVVLILDRETFDFRVGRLRNPPRVFIDIAKARFRPGARLPALQREKGLVRRLRIGRPDPTHLRFVIDLAEPAVRHRVFTLPEPDRIVVDLRKRETLEERPPSAEARAGPSAGGRAASAREEEGRRGRLPFSSRKRRRAPAEKRRRGMNLEARFRAGLGRIVLDPGHGGRDPGTTGLYGLVEKSFVLDIALRTATALRRRMPGNRVVLTRRDDRYIPLEDRTSLANEHDADVFVSIHANSAPQRRTSGIETYLLSEASNERSLKLAARESETTVRRMSDLQKILHDLMLRSKVSESQQLAQKVQRSIISRLNRRFSGVKSLGVKRGPFYVLVGARMPSILIETAFISNPIEARRSRTARYRQTIAEGIAEGVARFVGLPSRRARAAAP